MNIERCKNDHFFDVDTYSVCPTCGFPAGGKSSKAEEPKKKLFGKIIGKKNSRKGMNSISYLEIDEDIKSGLTFSDEDMFGNSIEEQEAEESNKSNSVTVDFWSGSTFNSRLENLSKPPEKEDSQRMAATEKEKDQEVSDMTIAVGVGTSLKEELQRVSSAEDGKTFGYFSLNRAPGSGQADSGQQGVGQAVVPVSNDQAVVADRSGMAVESRIRQVGIVSSLMEPVVGILACIKGPHLGECFGIYAGRNPIGRNEDNRIVLYQDLHVSRQKHAFITYEPRKREFFVQPGESNGLTYYNGDNILESRKMVAGDEIEIGQSTLKLFPICTADFSWETYQEQ